MLAHLNLGQPNASPTKTTAIACLYAALQYNPSPVCIQVSGKSVSNRVCNAMSSSTSIPYLLNEDHKPYPVGCPGGTVGKESACQSRRHRKHGFSPWVRKWQSTPVFLPRKSHGQRSLVGYSPWARKELAALSARMRAQLNRALS